MPTAAEFRQLLEQHRPHYLPGCVTAAALGDGPVVVACYGRDAEGVELTDDSLFPFASITKLATALAILRLVDDDRTHSTGGSDTTYQTLMRKTRPSRCRLSSRTPPVYSG